MAGAPASPASDIYAATATFYECLTGRPPFSGNTAEMLLRQHRSHPVPVDSLPVPLRPLVAAGMAKDPARRPTDAIAFVAELTTAAAGAYGRGWHDRGRSHLGEAALLLAALWPSGPPPAVQGTTVQRIPLRRRVRLRHISGIKAAAAAGAAITIVAAGTALAATRGSSHQPSVADRPLPAQPISLQAGTQTTPISPPPNSRSPSASTSASASTFRSSSRSPTSAPTSPQPTAKPTSRPSTSARTSAPPTSGSPTSAPPTSAPPTSAPPTSAPPTSAPPTSAPPTSAPPTSAPPTSAPPTSAPVVPEITSAGTYTQGELVYFNVQYADPGDNAEGFGFVGVDGSGWGEETHPFSSPSYGIVGPDSIAYPFNEECGTPQQYDSYVQVWIYDTAGDSSTPVVIHLVC